MALSKAEWQRRKEKEDAQPSYFGMTMGEFDALPLREQQRTRQRYTQYGATYIGFWKDCNLAKCRRAKRCCGFLTEAQYALRYPEAFPPCTRGEEKRRARILYEGLEVLAGRMNDTPKYAGRPSDNPIDSDETP